MSKYERISVIGTIVIIILLVLTLMSSISFIVTTIYLDVYAFQDDLYTAEDSIFTCIEETPGYIKVYDRDTKVIYVINPHGALAPLYNADGTLQIFVG